MAQSTQIAKKNKNRAIALLLLGGLSILGVKGYNLYRWYEALGITFTGKISGYRNGNFILRCKAVLDNPKNFSITITKPTIRIYNGNTLLAKSAPSSQKVKIEKNAITTIDYEIEVPALSGELYRLLLQAGIGVANYISDLIAGNNTAFSLGIELDTIAYMQLPFGINREWKQKMTI